MFRDKVKDIMEEKKINQKELSSLSGITESSVSRYLSGDRTPRIDIIINFAKALNVEPSYLIENDEDLKKKEDAYIECHTMLARNRNFLSDDERYKLISLLSRDR